MEARTNQKQDEPPKAQDSALLDAGDYSYLD
jgi:hypothetical protein